MTALQTPGWCYRNIRTDTKRDRNFAKVVNKSRCTVTSWLHTYVSNPVFELKSFACWFLISRSHSFVDLWKKNSNVIESHIILYNTFFDTRKSEELNQTIIISGCDDAVCKWRIGGVDVIDLRIFRPNAVDLRAKDACPRVPLYGCYLLGIGHVTTSCKRSRSSNG